MHTPHPHRDSTRHPYLPNPPTHAHTRTHTRTHAHTRTHTHTHRLSPLSTLHSHADQVIRGIYEPFVAEWRAAFPSSLLVLRAEDLYDDKAASRAKLRAFLGIEIEHEIEIEIEPPASQSRSRSRSGDADAAAGLPSLSYAQQHAASLAKPDNAHKAAPMHAHTRQKLAAFYRPHSQRLATLLQDPKFAWE